MKRKHWYVAEFMAPANRQDMRGGFMKGWEVGEVKIIIIIIKYFVDSALLVKCTCREAKKYLTLIVI